MAPLLDPRAATAAALVTALAMGAPASAGGCCALPVRISEVRTAYPAPEPQDNEYFELVGPPGTPLDCMFYVVLDATGTVEEIVPLTGASIPPDGHFLAGQVDPLPFFGVSPDLLAPLNFVDAGNHTHLLVCSCQGLPGIEVGVDLDVDDDGSLDMPPWDCVLDCIGLVENPLVPVYCHVSRGPTPAGGPPSHVFRCQPPGYWVIGPAMLPGGADTPGVANPPCTPGGPVVTAFGMPHTGLGDAQMLYAPGGELLITNIGPTGADGVSIDPGRADFMCLVLGTLSLKDLLDGSIHVTAGGQINNAPVAEISHVGLEGGVGGINLHAGFPPATSDLVDVTLYSGGATVHESTVSSALLELVMSPWDIPDGLPPIICEFAPKPSDEFPLGEIGITLTLPSATMMSVGPETVMADKVVIQPTERFEYDAYDQVQLTAADLMSLGIAGELLGRFDFPHDAVGNATLAGQCEPEPVCTSEQLMVGGIGPAGYDGVHMRAPYYVTQPGGMIIGLIIYTDLTGATPGAILMADLALTDEETGMAAMMPYSTITDLGGSLTEVMFAWETAGQATLGYSLGGKVVASHDAGDSPHKAVVPVRFTDFLTVETEVDQDAGMCYTTWCTSIVFGVPGHKGVQADTLFLCAPCDPDISPGLDLDVFLTAEAPLPAGAAGGPWSFLITGEDPILLPDCPPDIDGDGTVGILDFLALLAAWGPCPGCAEDIDGDGTVGILDFLALLAAWGTCP